MEYRAGRAPGKDTYLVKKLKKVKREGSEKAMAPHSSTLAWKIPWMEEPGRLCPWGR